ncbi:arylamine N-acetyltransferase [Streptomyces sp. NPDC052095]|uniref:arylamine N-acetyltransferase family protein n=1 Tax=unclassified Streptomyces TaxID=2593676 RepID=UPI00344BB4BE
MTSDRAHPLDLDAYLARIGLPGEHRPTAEVLRAVHRAHSLAIPFENLDPVLGSAPSLALADLEAKLVRGRRGGYCFEHNTLFAAALTALGFRVTTLGARVVLGAAPGAVRPRTHMLMTVAVPGEPTPYAADVGFGSTGGLLEPIPLAPGAEVHDSPRRHRLVTTPHDGPLERWELQAYTADGAWESQYAFTPEPFEAPDFEAMNWYIATYPRSPFRTGVRVQRTVPGAHLALVGRTLTVTADDGGHEVRELADGDEVLRVLAAEFGIHLPSDTRLPG